MLVAFTVVEHHYRHVCRSVWLLWCLLLSWNIMWHERILAFEILLTPWM